MLMRKSTLIATLLTLTHGSSAFAAEGLNSGDTAWMIVSTALVMMMTPAGLALFYGGMSRYKNLLNTLATGLFANPAVNASASGLFYGNPKQLWIQIVSILATALYTAVGTIIVVYVVKLLCGGLRLDREKEMEGLDSSVHGERAFEIPS